MGSSAATGCYDFTGVTSGIIGTGFGMSAYNQAAYMGSVAMRQSQVYQEKNYGLSWVAIARDDVRDMMTISISRINNYMIVATLILGISTSAILGADMHERAPDFLVQAFWVSMGISILFFGLSIMFSVKGQNAAFLNTMRLLTWEIRPETPASYDHDYLQQAFSFEREGLGALFRLPLMRMRHGQQAPPAQGAKARLDVLPAVHSFGSRAPDYYVPNRPNAEKEASREGGPFEQLAPESRQLLYLARFGHFMQLWQPFDTHSRQCIGLGLVSLTQGAAYFTLCKLTSDRKLNQSVTAVSMISIFSYIIFAICQQNLTKMPLGLKIFVNGLFFSGPVAGTVAAIVTEPEWVRQFLAPLGCLCHCLLYLMMLLISLRDNKSPLHETKKFTRGPAGQQFPEDWQKYSPQMVRPDLRDLPSPRPAEGEEHAKTLWEAEEAMALSIHNTISFAVRGALVLSASLWFCIFVTTVLAQIELNPFRYALPIMSAEQLPVLWPLGASLWPTSLACARDDVFVATRYRVFRVPMDGGTAVEEPCLLDGPIMDVAAACNGTRCWPLVLLEGGREVVDCKSAQSLRLLQERTPAERISLHGASADEPLGGVMLAKHGSDLVEYSWAAARNGWAPQWRRGAVEEGPVDLDLGRGRLFLFGMEKYLDGTANFSNFIEVRNLTSERRLGKWKLPQWKLPHGYGSVVAGCHAGDNKVLLLLDGRDPPLLNVELPGIIPA